jgi:hypothetical protein
MTLIKVSDKHSDLKLRFEHPITLNPEKKYKLGVSHLMFSFEKEYDLNVLCEWYILVPESTASYTVKSDILGKYTIVSLKNMFQTMFTYGLADLIELNKKENKKDINQKLRKIKPTPVKKNLI